MDRSGFEVEEEDFEDLVGVGVVGGLGFDAGLSFEAGIASQAGTGEVFAFVVVAVTFVFEGVWGSKEFDDFELELVEGIDLGSLDLGFKAETESRTGAGEAFAFVAMFDGVWDSKELDDLERVEGNDWGSLGLGFGAGTASGAGAGEAFLFVPFAFDGVWEGKEFDGFDLGSLDLDFLVTTPRSVLETVVDLSSSSAFS